jgi:hypothetical protein
MELNDDLTPIVYITNVKKQAETAADAWECAILFDPKGEQKTRIHRNVYLVPSWDAMKPILTEINKKYGRVMV